MPVTPEPAVGVVPAGTVNAGHTWVHPLEHVLIPLWSLGRV